MAHFTRRSLYELVWSKPTRTIAAEIGVSDVWLAKACRAANIPIPERGYWTRKQANKPTITRKLPPRFPGADDEVTIGGNGHQHYHWGPHAREEILKEPVPPVPTFDEEIEAVEERVRKMVGKVSCPRQITQPHKLIAVLIERDEKRRAEYEQHRWGAFTSRFESTLDKRRLRIWNAIFNAATRIGCKPSIRTGEYVDNRNTSIQVADKHVAFTLDPVNRRSRGAPAEKERERLRLTIGAYRPEDTGIKSWEDDDECDLEERMTEIVVEMVMSAERSYRQSRFEHRLWLIRRKAEIEEEMHKERIEAERKARELRAKQEKERIDRLIGEAHALDQSATIRAYVSAVRTRSIELPLPSADIELWAAWALGEADRIDPVKNGSVQSAIIALVTARAQGE